MKALRFILVFGLLQQVCAQEVSGDPKKGAELFYDFACYSCHGYNATMRVPLVGDTSGIMSNEAVFLNYLRLRADQNPINPKNSMPNYSVSTLNDEQAKDIYAYLVSLKDDPPEIEDIPVFIEMLESAKQKSESKLSNE